MLRAEMRVLLHLGQYGQMTAREICSRTKMHKTKISRAVSALENKGYLTRETVEKDRRQEALSLTRAGRAAYADLGEVAKAHDAALRDRIGTARAAALKATLKDITQTFP